MFRLFLGYLTSLNNVIFLTNYIMCLKKGTQRVFLSIFEDTFHFLQFIVTEPYLFLHQPKL